MWAGSLGVLVLLLFLAGCGREIEVRQSLDDAVYAGIIVPPGAGVALSVETHRLEYVRRSNMYTGLRLSASYVPITERFIAFRQYGGVYSGFLGGNVNAVVQQGDLLAVQYFDNQDLTLQILSYTRAHYELEAFEATFYEESMRRLIQIEDLRSELTVIDTPEAVRQALQLEILEMQKELFLITNTQRQRVLREQRDNARVGIDPEHLYAPADGVLTFTWNAARGNPVSRAHIVARIAAPHAFELRATADPLRFRYGQIVRASALDGALTFDVRVASDPMAPGTRPMPGAMPFTLVPVDETALLYQIEEMGLTTEEFYRLRFAVDIHEQLAQDTLLITTAALRERGDATYVFIYDEGRVLRRYVITGLRQGNNVQILMGVEEGQTVILR